MRHRVIVGVVVCSVALLAGCGTHSDHPAAAPSSAPRPLAMTGPAVPSEPANPRLVLPDDVETVRTGRWTAGSVAATFPPRPTDGQVDIAFRCDGASDVVVAIGDGAQRTEVPTTCDSGFSTVTYVPARTALTVRATGKATAQGAYAVSLTPVRH